MQPGVYNETAFLGLDTVIYEASRAGLRVIIVLANNWDYCGDWKWVTILPLRSIRVVSSGFIQHQAASLECPVPHSAQRISAVPCQQPTEHAPATLKRVCLHAVQRQNQVYHAVAGVHMQISALPCETAMTSSQILWPSSTTSATLSVCSCA